MATLHTFLKIDLDALKKVGVYSIHHKEKPDDLYIGSTCKLSKDAKNFSKYGFYKRFYDHMRNLNLNIHHCNRLQNVVNKYGLSDLVFTIIESYDTAERSYIFEREQYYIDTLKPTYNTFNTVHPQGRTWTEEERIKKKKLMINKHFPKEVYDKLAKPVYQFSLEGKFINEFSSSAAAAKSVNVDSASIRKCASGKRKTAGNYIWSYDKILEPVINTSKVYQYNLNGDLIKTYKNLESVIKELNLKSRTAIKNCFIGKQKQAYGYIWKNFIKAHGNKEQG